MADARHVAGRTTEYVHQSNHAGGGGVAQPGARPWAGCTPSGGPALPEVIVRESYARIKGSHTRSGKPVAIPHDPKILAAGRRHAFADRLQTTGTAGSPVDTRAAHCRLFHPQVDLLSWLDVSGFTPRAVHV